ncbi:MAG: HAD hydrolase-like protein [Sphaerochaeta sp.]|uniref:HAD hydrolase-like protein n=1 Tax=Sphaerochaeta sp. TaxID=1972642 RepID=UPI00297A1399|nr:HAD hydrolase-like protein [Sphaerochaeta sp.]MDD3928819.1 HAD hydrolase-like protein [Sphaerochaeta sp.]
MNFKLVIFDLDGTLMNTSAGIFSSANATVEKLGMKPEHDPSQLSKFIGPPINQCFVEVYNMDQALIEQAVALYRVEYDKNGRFNAEAYPNMKETLTALKEKGYQLAVGTLKHESLAQGMMTHFGFDHYFDSIRGSDLNSHLSKADIIRLVLNDLNVRAEDAVLIGDTIHDQKGAAEAGIAFIAVDYGFGFPKNSPKQESMLAMVGSAEELLTLL